MCIQFIIRGKLNNKMSARAPFFFLGKKEKKSNGGSEIAKWQLSRPITQCSGPHTTWWGVDDIDAISHFNSFPCSE